MTSPSQHASVPFCFPVRWPIRQPHGNGTCHTTDFLLSCLSVRPPVFLNSNCSASSPRAGRRGNLPRRAARAGVRMAIDAERQNNEGDSDGAHPGSGATSCRPLAPLALRPRAHAGRRSAMLWCPRPRSAGSASWQMEDESVDGDDLMPDAEVEGLGRSGARGPAHLADSLALSPSPAFWWCPVCAVLWPSSLHPHTHPSQLRGASARPVSNAGSNRNSGGRRQNPVRSARTRLRAALDAVHQCDEGSSDASGAMVAGCLMQSHMCV